MSQGIHRIFFLLILFWNGSIIIAQSTTQYYHRKPQSVQDGQDVRPGPIDQQARRKGRHDEGEDQGHELEDLALDLAANDL